MNVRDWLVTEFVKLKRVQTDDGYGNTKADYTQGESIMCGLSRSSYSDPVVSDHVALSVVYNLVFRDATVNAGQLVMRLSDGAVFEVLSNSSDFETPEQASEAMRHSECQVRRVTLQ